MLDQVKVFKALADETRLRLMRLLARGALNVNEIIGILEMGQSRVSRHLRILAEADLVTSRREGTWIYYQWSSADGASTLVGDTLAHLGAHERDLSHFESDIQGLEAVVARRPAVADVRLSGLGTCHPERRYGCPAAGAHPCGTHHPGSRSVH